MTEFKSILVTGGCGFIGSNFVRYWLGQHPESQVIVYDKLTYAGRRENLTDLWDSPNLSLVVGDIADLDLVRRTCQDNQIDLIVNFAAETHVDQSILGPLVFTDTNVRGTHVLLEVARELNIRLHHISTDEVYGHIADEHQSVETDNLSAAQPLRRQQGRRRPTGAGVCHHLRFARHHHEGGQQRGAVPVPRKGGAAVCHQCHPRCQPIPVYGDGLQMRDYAHVHDHCTGIEAVLLRGVVGEVYNVGTGKEMTNLEMVDIVLDTLGKSHDLVRHVTDQARP